MKKLTSLAPLRQAIDSIDSQIQKLIIDRSHLVKKIAKLKTDKNIGYFRPKRELSLLRERLDRHEDSFSSLQILTIFRMIIGGSIAMQDEDFTVFYSNTLDKKVMPLVMNYFGPAITCLAKDNLEKIASNLSGGELKGIIILENKANWSDTLINNPNLKVCGILPWFKKSNADNNECLAYICANIDNESLPDGAILVKSKESPHKNAITIDQNKEGVKIWQIKTADNGNNLKNITNNDIVGCIPSIFLL